MLIFKKRLEDTHLFSGYTDWHSHLLPGVDDGIKTTEDSLKILDRYEKLGVKRVWLTPHIMEDMPNTTSSLKQRFDELKSHYSGNIELCLASENMLDNVFEERLESNDLLPISDSADHLLVETSYFNAPFNFWAILETIQKKGYYVLLAHPERYRYMDTDDYDRLKEMNVKLQLNVPSLTGFYGHDAKHKAEWLLKKGYYNTTGFDLHSVKSMNFILGQSVWNKTAKRLERIRW